MNEVFQRFGCSANQIIFLMPQVKCPKRLLAAIIEVDDVPLNFREKLEAMLSSGDTNSCISAIPAKRRKIPIFHMEAGNRCFDQRVPEETNRK